MTGACCTVCCPAHHPPPTRYTQRESGAGGISKHGRASAHPAGRVCPFAYPSQRPSLSHTNEFPFALCVAELGAGGSAGGGGGGGGGSCDDTTRGGSYSAPQGAVACLGSGKRRVCVHSVRGLAETDSSPQPADGSSTNDKERQRQSKLAGPGRGCRERWLDVVLSHDAAL